MNICLFNKFGHCKFQSKCRKRHIEKKCEKEKCEIQNCLEKHPRECSYYRDFGRCKFGSYCSFDHKASKDDTIIKLEKDLNDVKNRLDEIEVVLKSRNKHIEFILAALKDKTDDNNECSYGNKNEKLLSININDNEMDNYQTLPSTPSVGKTSISPQQKFKCYLCGKLLPSKSDLIKHLDLTHKGQPKKLVYEDCDQICTHYPMLYKHKETEHDIYLCARCNIQFYGKDNLGEHEEKHHGES